MTEKLNEFFASIFTVGNAGHVPSLEPQFGGRVPEELGQIEVTRNGVLGLLGKLNTNKSPAPDGILRPEGF